MASIRLVAVTVCVLAVTYTVSGRPQFPFLQGGIGLQTPIGGIHLGVPTGLTVNVGRKPPEQPPVQAIPVEVTPVSTTPLPESTRIPTTSGLGVRLDESPQPVSSSTEGTMPVDEQELNSLEPCPGVDPAPESTDDESATTTEVPCGGIGAGNRINPKQAALLSLVG
ncbi:uncharacterized protein LOC128720879 [Anopheles nili]|uniref:uncharacterized protein LOC128720879 n=1 Tax=Anopheles nili TaxID=185578 RepID=UPI00237B7BC3|nr:uncharacterized protein LOC128720879 [Anopheles nili]